MDDQWSNETMEKLQALHRAAAATIQQRVNEARQRKNARALAQAHRTASQAQLQRHLAQATNQQTAALVIQRHFRNQRQRLETAALVAAFRTRQDLSVAETASMHMNASSTLIVQMMAASTIQVAYRRRKVRQHFREMTAALHARAVGEMQVGDPPLQMNYCNLRPAAVLLQHNSCRAY
eukprot:SAG31_NODE_1042_length_10187_cov_54.452121_9_plen_179_part_00